MATKDALIQECEALIRGLGRPSREAQPTSYLHDELEDLRDRLRRQREDNCRENEELVGRTERLEERKRTLLPQKEKLRNRTKELKVLIHKEKELHEAAVLTCKGKDQDIRSCQETLKTQKEKCIELDQALNQEKKVVFELTTQLTSLRVKLKSSIKVVVQHSFIEDISVWPVSYIIPGLVGFSLIIVGCVIQSEASG